MQVTFEINYDYGTYDPAADMVSLIFDNDVDSVQLYPYDACKSTQVEAGNGDPSQVSSTGITFESAPASNTVTLAFRQPVRDNTDVYTQSFNDGVQSDTLKLCVYAATLAEGNIEIGYKEVLVLLNFSASGQTTAIDVDVVGGPQNTVSSKFLQKDMPEPESETTMEVEEEDETSPNIVTIAGAAAGVGLFGLLAILMCTYAKRRHHHRRHSHEVDDKCTVKSSDPTDSTDISNSSDADWPLPTPSRIAPIRPPLKSSRIGGTASFRASASSRTLQKERQAVEV